MKHYKTFAVFLAFMMLWQIVAPSLAMAAQKDPNTITISSAKDLVNLSFKCSSDTWSQGKTVVLTNDIDLTDTDFTSIPTFGGVFDGAGHTIRGFSFKKNGSNQGFFRYLQPTGVLKQLTIKGVVIAGGSKNNIGGLVGTNQGMISNCVFNGQVKGGSYIGGLVGLNQGEGTIANCQMNGMVYGEHYVGGVAGQNLGKILLCVNTASVNTSTQTTKINKETLDLQHINATTNTDQITDVGGITGYSSGVIQSCSNKGNVGYEHIGYNIGGIAGRQSGYINGCKNEASIFGRKDIGGIVGQMEPYMTLQFSQSSLASIGDELDSLQKMVDQTIADATVGKSNISTNLSSAQDDVDRAKAAVDSLTNQTTDLINSDINSVNDISARVAETLGELKDAMNAMEGTSDKMAASLDQLKDAMDTLDKAANSVPMDDMHEALDKLSAGIDYMQQSFVYIRKAMTSLERGLGDVTQTQEAFKDLSDGISMLSTAMVRISQAVNDIKAANTAFKTILDQNHIATPEQIQTFIKAVSASLETISNSASDLSEATAKIGAAIQEFPTYLVNNTVNDMIDAIDQLDIAIDRFASGTGQIQDALTIILKSWGDLKAAGDGTKDAISKGSDAVKTLKESVDLLSGGVSRIRTTLQGLADKPTITFQKIDDHYLKTKDQLSGSLSNISQVFRTLNTSMTNASDLLLADMKAVSNQLFRVFDLLVDSVQDTANKSTDRKDYMQDVSPEDTKTQTEGKVANSQNSGKINGDIDTGGITGSMAIEYDFDPEDDITKKGDTSLNFLYSTRAVVRDCTNEGEIVGKKNYVGGIAGKMDLGSLIGCVGNGEVTSNDGDYVGGIAGYSSASISQCYAKCTLLGDDYVGGIAGQAKTITDCYTIVRIKEGDESIGAIAGKVEGTYTNNYFVSDDLGGVDGISYVGRAEAKTYEDLVSMPGIPDLFHYFTLTFLVDGRVVDQVKFRYGSSLQTEDIPKVPKKNGCFGKWSKKSFENLLEDETVKAVYGKYVTSIESKKRRDNGLPIVVEEGNFASTSLLNLERACVEHPNLKFYEREIECWKLSVTEDTKDENKVHYLLPEPMSNIEIMVLKNDKWRQVKTQKDGRYIVFPVSSDEVTFCVVKTNKIANRMLTMALIACGVLLIVLAWLSVLARRKKWPIKQKRLWIVALLILAIASSCGILLFI